MTVSHPHELTSDCCPAYASHTVSISQLLLTVLGFVVGLALSFRSSTAYERYNEGRRYWAELTLASQNLARLIWIHADEREGELKKKDLPARISAVNLIAAFSVALKHKLRFEPYVHYDDLKHLVRHLDTYAKAADHLDVRSAVRAVAGAPLSSAWGRAAGVDFVSVPRCMAASRCE